MKLMSLSYCLFIAKPWLWKVPHEKARKRNEDQNNSSFYATRLRHCVKHCFMRALVGVNSITGYDNISDVFGKGSGKQSRFSKSMEGTSELWWVSGWSDQYARRPLHSRYGSTRLWTVPKEVSLSGCAALWDLLQGGKVKLESLPPCKSSFRLHKSNYQAAIDCFVPLIGTLSTECISVGLASCHLCEMKRFWKLRGSIPKTGPLRFGSEIQFPLTFAH